MRNRFMHSFRFIALLSCSECVFTIQEAESALDSALHPSHGAGDIAGMSSPVAASGGPRSKSPSRASPSRSKSRGVDAVSSPPQASPQEAGADSPSGHAPSYDAAPASRYAIEAPADLLSNLDESDLPKLKAVAARAVEVGGDARLVAAAATVISRLEAGLVLQDAISALQSRRFVS